MRDAAPDNQLERDIAAFKDMERWWQGGYYEGDPLDPIGISNYGKMGFMSVLYATYLTCIKPYVRGDSVVLEIGPGRGAWTRAFLHAKEIWCLDALSAENNNFWNYVGQAPQVKYFQVTDFSCSMVPENAIDYFFSFGCFCHVSFAGVTEYMKNLRTKLKDRAHCFIMVADFKKYNAMIDNIDQFDVAKNFSEVFQGFKGLKFKLIRSLYRLLYQLTRGTHNLPGRGRRVDINVKYDAKLKWYDAGTERTCAMLRGLGYTIVDPDVRVNYRDPVIHFTK